MFAIQNMELCSFMRDLWNKDELTFLHSFRVTQMAISFAKFLQLSPNEIKTIELGGLLHDIGKINIDSNILNKTSKLSCEEYAEIKKHPLYGGEILSKTTLGQEVYQMVLYHHERWDGAGYPYGLSEKNIPFLARLLALTDTLEAITGIRPYRSSLSWEEAYLEIDALKGTQFDPYLANEFLIWMKHHEIPIVTNSSLFYQKIFSI
ncbi:HD-GYP domain-containing protein [Peribacillus tepidiphilus]|jgi:putative nucleotidyltransferase with HDIG domain|uniref:HD-GYP domain-containing protein n=1 Tax=Peribacillus tepidiphilus TaxID=2652445 RepID=UPI0035B53965